MLLLFTFIWRYSPFSSRLTCDSTWVNSFLLSVFDYPLKWCTLKHWHGWCCMKLLPSRHVLCTPYNHATSCKKHKRKVHVCSAVTCHLHFWQNGKWNGKCAKEKYIISLTKQKDLWQEWSTQSHAAKAEHTHQYSFWCHLETQHCLHKLQTIMS